MPSGQKIRVVHIITTFSVGGATETALLCAAGLNATGRYEVTILAGPPNSAEGSLLDDAERWGVRVDTIPALQRDISPWQDVAAFFQLTNALRKSGCAIAHTHSSKAGILGRFAARVANVPLIVHTFHGLPYTTTSPVLQRVGYQMIERCAGRISSGTFSVTHDILRRLKEARIGNPERSWLARSGMDLDRFLRPDPGREEVRRRWGVHSDDVLLGMVGRVHTGKGQDVIVRLAPEILRDAPNAKIAIIGTGPLKDRLQEQVARAGLSDRVLFVGGIPVDEMPEAISALDVLVHVSEREGLARVIVQALACGKPVISYALDGSPEVIADRTNGRLIPPGNDDALREAIRELVRDPRLREEWGAKGPAAVDPEFRAETMIEQIEAGYRDLLRHAGIACSASSEVRPFAEWPPSSRETPVSEGSTSLGNS
ncbi:MAG TPA: glycosyltransferase family 4 protein [Candidatus Latescibacteria bacterium]|nr:glycosyltransferase family 4 protein [Candidatus Latescibacterota bacterium]HOS63390.1 glycosyltransferase family 4 protein [Candidatus Latescibacterota bacterium]HPK75443.1 glycosyltransferase family 4 protein [Candidatus Latescibacterota bacterium]